MSRPHPPSASRATNRIKAPLNLDRGSAALVVERLTQIYDDGTKAG
jgi:hypothetical protein